MSGCVPLGKCHCLPAAPSRWLMPDWGFFWATFRSFCSLPLSEVTTWPSCDRRRAESLAQGGSRGSSSLTREDEGLTGWLVNQKWRGNSARGKSCSHGPSEGSWIPSLLCLLCLISYKLVVRKVVLIVWLLPPEASVFEEVPQSFKNI